jgi:DNA-binding transcriptional LysR family regulator
MAIADHRPKERWLLREQGSGTLNVIEKALAENGLRLESVQEIGHTEAIKRAVEADMGISCLSRRAVSREAASGQLAALKVSPPLFRWFKLLNYRGRYQSREAKAFSDWLRGGGRPQDLPRDATKK